MGENNVKSDSSWKKMVIAKTNNAWSSTMKSERTDDTSTMNTSNFSLEQVPIPFAEVKVEYEGINTPSFQTFGEHYEATSSNCSYLDEVTPQKRRRKGSGPKPESPEERASRLAKMSAYAAQRLANETPEQRALRLKRMSDYAAKRLAHETSEQRAKRLQRMSAYAAKRLAGESPEQRRLRLSRMSAYAAKRHAIKKFMNSAEQQVASMELRDPLCNDDSILPDQS